MLENEEWSRWDVTIKCGTQHLALNLFAYYASKSSSYDKLCLSHLYIGMTCRAGQFGYVVTVLRIWIRLAQ